MPAATRASIRPGPRPIGPLGRGREEPLAGGLAPGLSRRLGFAVSAVRTAFVVAALANGFGLAAYVLAWLLVPRAGDDSNIASKALTDRRGIAPAAPLGALLVLVLLIASALGAGWPGPVPPPPSAPPGRPGRG